MSESYDLLRELWTIALTTTGFMGPIVVCMILMWWAGYIAAKGDCASKDADDCASKDADKPGTEVITEKYHDSTGKVIIVSRQIRK